uniref:Glutathione S-transferase n=1 Tax=Strigamia maritima TaxID=126957 RepID=T1J645_STRMM
MAPLLAYWSIRGLAQPIRLLLNYVGQEFEDKKYDCGPPPNFDKSCWFNEKFSLGLDFPNLPYYIDEEVKLTQSGAIMRYLAEKHNLVPKKLTEKARMMTAEYQLADLRSEFVGLCYSPNHDALKDEFTKKLPDIFKAWSKFLGKNKWMSGDTLSYVDFNVYETFDHIRTFKEDIFNDYINLKEYMDRFEALPAISEYMKSEKFIKNPINNKMAKFGNE